MPSRRSICAAISLPQATVSSGAPSILSRCMECLASLALVMPALVAGIPLREALCPPKRDGRDEPGHDGRCEQSASPPDLITSTAWQRERGPPSTFVRPALVRLPRLG